ncbi:MAG: sulfotransferase [Steroidobacteraceae bacterium]
MTDTPAQARSPAPAQMNARQLDEALRHAERAVDGARALRPEHGLRAFALMRLGRAAEAEEAVTSALRLEAGSADAYDGLAFISMALGKHERANELYLRATQLAPGDPKFWYNLACSERSLGRLQEAEAACDRAVANDAGQYASYLLRSELRVQTAAANHIEELETLLSRRSDDYRARVFLGYALGKELDDLERFDEAFGAFATAARARRERLDYDVAVDEAKLGRIAQVYDQSFFDAAASSSAGAGSVDSSRFIFIVGLPRSGTTLLERILTGLPGVRSNGETDNFSHALMSAVQGDGDVFARAARADSQSVANEYARLALAGPPADAVIEKLPLNYLYLGAIRRALPEARILLVSRSPLDSCFAMYRTLFAAGYPFSYDLKELARYYAAYDRLVAHWRATLGEHLHEVHYRELVAEPIRIGAAVAAHCGLHWSDTAVDIQQNKSVSLTASASQVRRPIYGSSSGRWRKYERHLGELIATLGEHSASG